MTAPVRMLLALCSLLTAAHFLRFGNLWLALPALFPLAAAFFPRILPRPLLILSALAATFLWTQLTIQLVLWRIATQQPWVRLAIILGAVSLTHALLTLLLARPKQTTGQTDGLANALDTTAWVRTAAFVLTAGILTLARYKAPVPLLLGERFFPDSGPFWTVCFALYASLVAGLFLGPRHARARSLAWFFFSLIFFGQLALGLTGWTQFLMTGNLHLPVPALIISGPLYRGQGFFMLILFGVSLLLVGSAWCSHLCYFGAWDDRASRLAATKIKPLPAWTRWLRQIILILAVAAPLLLKALGVSNAVALGAATSFGLAGILVMIFYSRRNGVMTHCTVWCPVGLVANLAGRMLPWRIRMDSGCTRCGACSKVCRYNALTATDLAAGRPGLSCSLCGDCLSQCSHGVLHYAFFRFSAATSRRIFVTLAASLHAVFLAVARI